MIRLSEGYAFHRTSALFRKIVLDLVPAPCFFKFGLSTPGFDGLEMLDAVVFNENVIRWYVKVESQRILITALVKNMILFKFYSGLP